MRALSCYTVAMNDFKKPKLKEKTDRTSWSKVADWYDEMLEGSEETYQSNLILPNTLRLLEIKKGETLLDLGCGQGFFSREFFKAGAAVSGIDLSPKLISLAKEKSSREIKFGVSPADRLPFFPDGSFDIAVCVLAIQNMKNVTGVFEESFRVLKKGGRMLVVMNHPVFRIPKASSWGFDETKKIQYRRVDSYISESKMEIVMNPGFNPKVSTVSFHHPLQFYFKSLRKAGFLISRLEEWNSQKKSQPGPRADAENRARKEFPLFLALEAMKIN